MAKKAVKKTTARKKTSASSKAATKKAPARKTAAASDEDADFLAGLSAEEDATIASDAVSLVESKPGQGVANCTRLPGGILLQWGRCHAPAYGASDHRVEFPQQFGGVPAVTSSFLYGRAMSASDRYLLDVDDEGFNWRNINPLGELMWIAVGPAG